MTPERQEKIIPVLEQALELEGAEREAYLTKECAGRDDFRAEVERLLEADQKNKEDPMDPEWLVHKSLLPADGRYKFVRVLGQGGYGRVYLAEDKNFHDQVAIKFLSIRPELGPDQISRFKQEARAARQIDHQNVVRIFDLQTSGPSPFIISEYVKGETLRDKLRDGPMSELNAIGIAKGIAEALKAAHDKGVVHRDIKPANVIIRDDGAVKVLDFGIAKLRGLVIGVDRDASTQHQTEYGSVIGTISYMSPEQRSGIEVDERADLWSLGVVLYEMLTRRVPFDGQASAEIPARMRAIVEKSLALDLDKRYQSAKDFLRDLNRTLEAIEEPRPEPDEPVNERHRVFISHSKHDANFAKELKTKLAREGIAAWLCSDDITPGAIWRKQVEKALTRASILIVIVSESSVNSREVLEEVHMFKNKDQPGPIIPVLVDDTAIPLSLSGFQWVDFRARAEDDFKKLLTAFGQAPAPAPNPKVDIGSPVALPAFSDHPTDNSPPLQFDVGTCWGLDRGTYIGLLAADRSLDLYDVLRRVEGALLEAKKNERANNFVSRWWFRVNPFRVAGGPESPADVWKAAVDEPDANLRSRIDQISFSPSGEQAAGVPGIVVEVDALRDDTARVLVDWVEGLLNRVFVDTEIAVVFDLLTDRSSKSRAALEKLVERLRSVVHRVPIYQAHMASPHREETLHPQEDSNSEDSQALDEALTAANAPPGSHLFSWLSRMASADRTRFLIALKENTAVKSWLDAMPKEAHTYLNSIDAGSLVADLDSQANLPANFDKEFLLLTRQFLPERFVEVLGTYRNSVRGHALNTAKAVAGSLNLVAEFFRIAPDGESDQSIYIDERLLDAQPEWNGSYLDAWVVSLLRKYWIERSTTVRAQLENYVERRALSPHLRAVTRLLLGKLEVGQFLRENGRDAYFAAINAGYDFEFPLQSAGDTRIDNADLWLLIAALPTNKQRLVQLLSLNQSQRAVFGLITKAEWNDIKHDRTLLQKLLVIRGSRSLHFRN